MTNITQIITALTTFPQRSQYGSSSAYALAVETWLGENQNLSVELTGLVPQLNTFVSEANTLSDSVSASETAINQIVNQVVNYRGDWVANYNTVGYSTSESVSYNNKIYYSKIDNNLVEPTAETSTSSWYYVGSIDEAPMDGHTYGRKNAGWAFVQEIAQTTTPILSGEISVNESTSIDITITNYSATAGYVVSSVSGTATRVGDTITFTANSVSSDTAGSISVSAVEAGETTSTVAVHNLTVVNVLMVADQALVYDSTTMAEFTTHTNTALTDTNTTLSAIGNTTPHEALSNIITQDVADTDFAGLKAIQSKLEFENISGSGSIADILETTTKVSIGDTLAIVKADNNINEMVSGVVTSNVVNTVSTVDIHGDGSGLALYEFANNINDSGGNYNGTLNGSSYSYVAGVFGNAFKTTAIDASTNVSIPNMLTPSFSISIWINCDSDANAVGYSRTFFAVNGDFALFKNGPYIGIYANTLANAYSIDVGLTSSTTYNIQLTYDNSTYTTKIYLNKVLVGTWVQQISIAMANNILINSYNGAESNGSFKGMIDQTRIFNKALSQDEVNVNYDEQITKYTLDTTSVTAGEIPSKVYAVGANPSFEISGGFVEATKASDTFTLNSPSVGMLSTIRTHNDVTDLTGSTTLQTKMNFEASGVKLTELTATVQKLG